MPLAENLGDEIALTPVDWMNAPSPWDLASVAGLVGSLAEDLRPAVILGHSTGGAIALQLALDRPDLVERLVLISTGAAMHGHGDVDRIIERLEAGEGEAVATAVVERSFSSPVAEPMLSRMMSYAATAPVSAAIEVLRSQRDSDFTPTLSRILCPTLIVHGRHDPARTLAHAEELQAGLTDATLCVVDAGHSPMFERPGIVAQGLRAWLDAGGGSGP
jgi:pimeloyl-ACP methyl ester carboxylesterase